MLNLNIWNLLFTVINLLILYILIKKFLFKPVTTIINQRQAEADQEYMKARAASDQADELKKKYEESMASIDEEKKQAVIEARKQANVEYDRILEEAKGKAEDVINGAKADAEAEKRKILNKAEAEITEMVINATSKVVGAKVNMENDRALYDQFLGKAGE